ncbi:MAG: hypothetical protein ACLQPN_22890 [Bryobacteraceae bacterium]
MSTETEARPIAVERHPYGQCFIEIEVYKLLNGRYKAWPYVGRSPSANSETKLHFVLAEDFQTRKLAVDAAVKEGQRRIDGGFDVGSSE